MGIRQKAGIAMAVVLAIVNQKGGVGKTTTSVNLAAILAETGKRVLLVDVDPQGNTTSGLGFDKKSLDKTTYDALINDMPIQDIIRESGRPYLSLCPANIQLAGAELELDRARDREMTLKFAIRPVLDRYDFILMDCPPSLGLLTLSALVAAQEVIVPIQGEYYALEGLTQLMETINLVKRRLNPDLGIFGVVITMYDARTQLSAQVSDEVRRYFGDKVFRTVIPRNVRLSEAPSFGKSIQEYDPRSRGAESYQSLAREVIRRAEGSGT